MDETTQAEAVLKRTLPGTDVRPHYWPESDRFWYRVRTGPGTGPLAFAHVAVDPEAGAREVVADPSVLPGATAEQEVRPEGRTPVPTARTGPGVHLRVVNESEGPVWLIWVSHGGSRHPYRRILRGRTEVQSTYGGHSWLVTDEQDRILGAFLAPDTDVRVIIDGSNPVDEGPRPPRHPRSPDGRWLPFFEDHDLWLLDGEADGGEGQAVRLTHDGTEDDPYTGPVAWSPDSTRLVARRVRTPLQVPQLHRIDVGAEGRPQPVSKDYPRAGDPRPVPRLRLFDVPGLRAIPLSDGLWPDAVMLRGPRWWPDSRGLMLRYDRRGHQLVRWIEIGRDGDARIWAERHTSTFVPLHDKAFWQLLRRSGGLLRMSEESGYNHLVVHDAEGTRAITSGRWVVLMVLRVCEEQGVVWFLAGGIHPGDDPYHVHLARVSLGGGPPTVLTAPGGTHRVRLTPSGAYAIVERSSAQEPPVTCLIDTEHGHEVLELERADITVLGDDWVAPERFCAPGRDGVTPIWGTIFRPAGFDPTLRYPVIEHIYAGPTGHHAPASFTVASPANALAELGFVVVVIDGMGTSHRSKAFHDVCWRNLADAGFPDRIAWLRAAAARFPELDLERVGIFGGSAGGQNALRALIAHHELYRVAAADCGCHDNRLDKVWWNEQWMGWPVGPHYAEQSNATLAHRMEGALLLTVGLLDENVDPASTLQVVDALVRADKDFELIVLPRAGHGAGGHPYVRKRRWAFFRRHLGGPVARSVG